MDIELSQIIFQIINFGVVAGALTFLLYKPVKKMLNERSEKVEAGQRAAEANLAEQQHIEEMKKKAQHEAEKAATAVLLEAEQAAAKHSADLLKKAKEAANKEAEKIIQAAHEEAAVTAREQKKQFADAVFATVEKIGLSLDKKAQEKYIDQELKTLLAQI